VRLELDECEASLLELARVELEEQSPPRRLLDSVSGLRLAQYARELELELETLRELELTEQLDELEAAQARELAVHVCIGGAP
jgi:hypothetical protein